MTHKTNKETNNKQTWESHLQMIRKYIGIHQERINEIFPQIINATSASIDSLEKSDYNCNEMSWHIG